MPLKYRLSLVFFFTVFILVFSVDAAHGPAPAHARRSLAFKKKTNRGLGDIVTGILGTQNPNSSPSTSPPNTTPTNTDPPTTTPTSTSASSSPDSCSGLEALLGNCSPPTSSSGSSSSPTTDTPTSTPSTSSPGSSSSSSSSSAPPINCPLGLDLLGNCPGSSSSSPSTTTDTPTSTPSTSSPGSSSPSPSSSAPPINCPVGLDLLGNCPESSSSSSSSSTPSTSSPGSSSPSPSSSAPPSITCPVGLDLLGNCPESSSSSSSSSTPSTPSPGSSSPSPSSSAPPINCPVGLDLLGNCPESSSSSSSSSTPSTPSPESSSPFPSSSTSSSVTCPGILDVLGHCILPTSSPAVSSITPSSPPNPGSSSSAPTPTSSPPVNPCGALELQLGLCSSISSPPVSTPPLTSAPQTTSSTNLPLTLTTPQSSSQPCDPLQSALGLCTTSSISGTPSQSSQLIGQSSGAANSSTSDSGSGISSTTPLVISFPSGTNTTVPSTIGSSSTTTSDTSSSFTPSAQPQYSFLTGTTLLGTSTPGSLTDTQTDPDAVPTLTFVTSSNAPSTTSSVVLPSDIPARIYPPTAVDPNSLSGYSIVSILFDQSLAWAFVAGSTQSQGQLFLWFPSIIQHALGISPQQVQTFALQVFVPSIYSGPADVNMLLTTFLLYIPSDQVLVLANQIKVESSQFYTSLGEPYSSLARHVNPAFAVNSVQDPNAVPGTASSPTSSGNKSRTDAIIGVASVLGGLALVVLGVLIFRSVKRSRDLRHRRLSDSNAPNAPYPDRTGRDFDQDSVGGQRRRSFYFAEDSLRGQQAVQQTAVPVPQPQGQHVMQSVSQVEYSYRTSPDGVRERRAPVVTGAISAPILTQSSLNW